MNDDKSGGRKIKITSILACGYERGAQIVAIQGGLVAKIYDPLYYQWINRFGRKMDIVREADADYSHEAAAYEHLKKQDEARKYVPRYEGSWIMNVKTLDRNGQQRQRSVRLILIEHLDGILMDGIYPHGLSREACRSILIKAIDAESTIYHAGVNHADFSPRNIFLVGNDLFSNDLKIKILDFNIAVVRPLRGEVYQKRERMENPVRRFWYGLDEFVDGGLAVVEGRNG